MNEMNSDPFRRTLVGLGLLGTHAGQQCGGFIATYHNEDGEIVIEKFLLCQLTVDHMYVGGALDCDCVSPCQEVVYERTLSERPWPNEFYLRHVLVNGLCHRKNPSYLENFCEKFRVDKDNANIDRMKNNFLRVKIFYEDLNYETIIEQPMYDWFRFVSDIGGTVGLFIGASVLSAFEIFQLIAEMLNYFCKKMFHRIRERFDDRQTIV